MQSARHRGALNAHFPTARLVPVPSPRYPVGMPLYEYRCQDCSHGFELLVRESTTFECPACHGQKLEKQLSVFAVAAGSARGGPAPMAMGPCGSCGHPDGPGSCSVN